MKKIYCIALFILFYSILNAQTDTSKSNITSLFEMTLEELMDVVITTAGKTEEKISDIPASVVVITKEDIRTYGYQSLQEILENVPGFYQVNDYSWDGAKIGVRGFFNTVANNDLLIFINGVPQMYPVMNSYPFFTSFVPVESIKRIEVIRGPMSVIYGGGAFFGVINIFTKGINPTSETNITASIGTSGIKRVVFSSDDNTGDFKYSLQASYNVNDGIDQPYDKMMKSTEGIQEKSTKNLLTLDERYISFSGQFKNYYTEMFYKEIRHKYYLLLPSVGNGSIKKDYSSFNVLGYKKKFSEKFKLDTYLGYSRIEQYPDYEWPFPNFYGYQIVVGSKFDFEATGFYTPNKNIEVKGGISYNEFFDIQNRLHVPDFNLDDQNNETIGNNSIKNLGIFSQVNYTYSPSLTFIAGLRVVKQFDYEISLRQATPIPNTNDKYKLSIPINNDDIEFIPRLAFIYTINKNNILKLLYGKAINQASWWSQHNVDLLQDIQPLKSEKIQTVELNFISTPISQLHINLSLFTNILENLIIRTHGLDDNGDYYDYKINAGKMKTYGAELTLQTKFSKIFDLSISGVYQKTSDEVLSDVDPSYSPNFLGYFKAVYHLNNDITIAATGNYVSSMKPAWNTNPDGSGSRIGDESKNNLAVNLNLRYNHFLVSYLSAGLKISNLFDTDFYYPTTTNINDLFPKGTLANGRQFIFSISCSL